MHNPLTPLFPKVVETLIDHGFKYFVRQSYPRGKTGDIKEAFLLTHYRELHEANAHFLTIRFDSRKYLYSISNAEEKARLMVAASQPEGYKVFVALIKDREWRPPHDLGRKVKSYLRSHGAGSDRNINITLSLQFGELILNIQAGVTTLNIPLADVEKS